MIGEGLSIRMQDIIYYRKMEGSVITTKLSTCQGISSNRYK